MIKKSWLERVEEKKVNDWGGYTLIMSVDENVSEMDEKKND